MIGDVLVFGMTHIPSSRPAARGGGDGTTLTAGTDRIEARPPGTTGGVGRGADAGGMGGLGRVPVRSPWARREPATRRRCGGIVSPDQRRYDRGSDLPLEPDASVEGDPCHRQPVL
ncbi:hypothetical protein GCM10011512_01560 [Tersicoccus solisilvae]|uniref:Uncharacterized protein n=1 Tax=Tersicoccus solisilvae TaxID=1882339 RepID=A0ABQ1NM74_9MICC|nr:hypothetical protein GCM10011512_01560 [Tersicoccus solisilvae]